MAQSEHVLGFSPDGKLFALINEHGILRVWDTQTSELKQEYTPNLHLVGPCSALTWIEFKKPRKSSDVNQPFKSLYIAMGTSNGGVILYSYAQGKIERTFKNEGHTGRVLAIAYDGAGQLYTSGEDGRVLVWSLTKDKRIDAWSIGTEKLYSMAYAKQSKNLILASHRIKVYCTNTKELLQSFTGHSSEVNLLNVVSVDDEGTEYALTTSRLERIICLWKLGKKGLNRSAACTLLMEDIAHCVACHVNTEKRILTVASVTRSGVIHVYIIPVDGLKAAKPIKPKVTIGIATDNQSNVEPLGVIAAHMDTHGQSQNILFGYGGHQFLVFEQVTPSLHEKMQVLIRADPKQLYMKNKSGKRAEVGTAVALKAITPILNDNDVEYQSAINVVPRKVKAVEMPMEARLQNLNVSDGAPLQSQSKVQMLVQALHSKDKTLLRSVLHTDDSKTIQLTLQRLPVQYVNTLFEELTQMMQRSHNNVEYSLRWLKTLAHTHSGQLMALGADDLMDKVGPIIGIIEYRTNCLKELSKLNGRLQLLASQIRRNDDDDQLNMDDVLVYEDGASSNSDMDDEDKSNVSDSEWNEEEDDGDGDEQMQLGEDDSENDD